MYAGDCTPDPTTPTSMYAERGSIREDTFIQTSTPLTARKAPSLKTPSYNKRLSIITAGDSSHQQTRQYSPVARSEDYSTLHNYSIPLEPSSVPEWPSSYASSFDTSAEDVSTTITNSRVYRPGSVKEAPARYVSSGEEVSTTMSDSWTYQPVGDERIASRRVLNEPNGASAAARRDIPYSPSKSASLGQETFDQTQSTQFYTLKTDMWEPSTWNREDPAHRRLVTPKTFGQMYNRSASFDQETFDESKSTQFYTLRTDTSDSSTCNLEGPAHRRLVTPKTIGQMSSNIAPQKSDRRALSRTQPPDTPVSPSQFVPQPDGGKRKLSFHSSYMDQTVASPPSKDDPLEAKRWDTNYERQQKRRELSQPDGGKRKLSFHPSFLDQTLASPPSMDDPLEAKLSDTNYEEQQQRRDLAQPDMVRRKISFHSSYMDQPLAPPAPRKDRVEPKLRDKNGFDSDTLSDTRFWRELTIISPFSQKESGCNSAARFEFELDSIIDRANGLYSPIDFKDYSTRETQRKRERTSGDSTLTSSYPLSDMDTLRDFETGSYLGTYQSPKKTHKNAPTKTIENVKNLTASTFSGFIKNQPLVVVMFHNSTTDKPGAVDSWATHSLKAPQGVNPAFGSVDCGTEAELCARESIAANPFFKLYSGGRLVNAVKDFGLLNYNT